MRADEDVDACPSARPASDPPPLGRGGAVRQQLDAQRPSPDQASRDPAPRARRAARGRRACAARRAPRSAPSARPDGRPAPRRAARTPRPRSCRHRRRPGAAGASGAAPARSCSISLDDARLRARQRERQPLVEARDELAVDHVADADGLLLERPLAQHERELHAQQLVEHQTPAGDALARPSTRACGSSATPARGSRAAAAAPHPRAPDRRCPAVGSAPSAVSTHPAISHVVSPGLLRLRVDGDDPPGPVADEVDDGVRHRAGGPGTLGLAEQRHLEAGLQLPLPPGLVEEDDPEPARLVAGLDGDHHLAGAGRGACDRAHCRRARAPPRPGAGRRRAPGSCGRPTGAGSR